MENNSIKFSFFLQHAQKAQSNVFVRHHITLCSTCQKLQSIFNATNFRAHF